MKKSQVKLIEIIAKNLPNQEQVSNINTKVTGQDLIEDVLLGGRKESDIKEVDPEKEYIIPNRLVMPVDHIARMKRKLKRYGKSGLIEYCKQYMKNKNTSKLEEAINMAF